MEPRAQYLARATGVVVVVVGCYLVLSPFVPAVLFAAVTCSATWRLYVRVRTALGDRAVLAALLMTLLLCVLVVVPSALLTANLARNLGEVVNDVQSWMNRGLPPAPDWLKSTPIVGGALDEYWHRLAGNRDEVMALARNLLEPLRLLLLGAAKMVGAGVLQLAIAAFVAFFFYRDGEQIVAAVRSILARLAGGIGDEILDMVDSTVSGVVLGIFGTALAQAVAAMAGFAIAGVRISLIPDTCFTVIPDGVSRDAGQRFTLIPDSSRTRERPGR